MTKSTINSELLFGKVNYIDANSIQFEYINNQHEPIYFGGNRYGKGEVGEFVIIESQVNLVLGRIIEIKKDDLAKSNLEIIGKVQLLGTIQMDTLRVSAGVDYYPSINDLIYSAPHDFIASIPQKMQKDAANITLEIGSIDLDQSCSISITPEKLFGRHLGILGATGGGKSYTTARILEECLKHNSKIILLDPTGEYAEFSDSTVTNVHLASPINPARGSIPISIPPECFEETDFIALFEPAGKSQGPKFREAIRSLRLVELLKIKKLHEDFIEEDIFKKIGRLEENYKTAIRSIPDRYLLEMPNTKFNPNKLCAQIKEEYTTVSQNFYKFDEFNFNHCLSLLTRINGIINSHTFKFVFKENMLPSFADKILSFYIDPTKRLLRIDMSAIGFEFKAREVISNVIGRFLLNKARQQSFTQKPIVIFLDEAHNFIGKSIGNEDTLAKLDAFELIAKEGRKFGLNVCLATQRPRDITEGVLSQLGTLIVHRLTNDRDREIVERACGEIDKAASDFLPSLQPGEAVIIGNDFPIPLTINIKKPTIKPNSEGANFQKNWA
ncbi:ATP-binding protein [Acinetobacter sp. ANC 4779]|uniref:ATP-binding protein n=1 Tax=Acinetobacter sp. ANC 4779 TaxID=2529848 RepID=UPI00103FAB72|nr:ATP-binding protein [Acinetobacter sp. ANC 4779]TCB49133.1 ATP-binding protein [Acinetobacter sp. ANC 4779]